MQDLIEYQEIELDFKLAPKTEYAVYLHRQVKPLKIDITGPYVRNAAGEIVAVDEQNAWISKDEGKTWKQTPLFAEDKWSVQDTHALCMTKEGVLVLSFLNMADVHFNWIAKTNKPTKNSRLHLWTVRSLDGGHTWEPPVLVQTGYCGATTTMIQLSSGELLMSAQNLDYDNGRHYSLTYRSKDQGQSWQASNYLDIGGQGHHGGCYEGTLVELTDGRVWYCIRTNLDFFWNAYSDDQGLTWLTVAPGMEASSSPAMLKRLQSGRILMVYNQLYAEGETSARRVAGQFSEVAASWHREELSIRFSEDDGRSWSDPVVIARCKDAWLSYPYVFEQAPGKIWLTTMQSHLKVHFDEKDFV